MVQIKMQIRPFSIPAFVRIETPPRPRQDGLQESPSMALEELSAEVLSSLCDEFRAAVFAKAGKADPVARADEPAERGEGGA